MRKTLLSILCALAAPWAASGTVIPPVVNGEVFPDTEGKHINAHGGGIIELQAGCPCTLRPTCTTGPTAE